MTTKSLIRPSLFKVFKDASPIISCILAIVFSIYNCHYEKIGSEVKNIEDEIDFDLPDGWSFARINSLVYIQTGASFKKEQATTDSTQTRVLRGGNILQGEYKFFDNDIFIDSQLVSDSILLLKNDLITPAVTSIENIGKLALIEQD